MTRRWMLGALGALLLSACGSDGSTGPTVVLDGTYTLTSVSGDPLPIVVQAPAAENGNITIELLGGALTLRPDGTYSDEVQLRYTESGIATPVPDEVEGTYRVEGSTINFTSEAAGTYSGVYNEEENRITTIAGGFALTYTLTTTADGG